MYDERLQVRTDLLAGRIPKRVYMHITFTIEAACGLAGLDLMKAHYDPEVKKKAYDKICETFPTDVFPIDNIRWPEVYDPLGAKNWVMSSEGGMQHPEIESMFVEDYDEYIEDPINTVVTKVLPRIYPKLDPDRPGAMLSFAKAYGRQVKTAGEEAGIKADLIEKYEYAPGFGAAYFCEAPFDFLADQMRGFKNIMIDVRRIPDKVIAAAEATLPLMVRLAIPRNPIAGSSVAIPLHMPPFMRGSDYEKFYRPTFDKLVEEINKAGMKAYLFAESDWTRYSDALAALPPDQIILYENGDVPKIKELVGDKHIIGGFFDPLITLTKTKEECIDEVKRLLDIGMPGGRFFFAFNRFVMDIESVDVSKLAAVLDYVRNKAVY